MKVYVATDHAGFELKEKVKDELIKSGYDVVDYGAHTFDKNDDYPDYIRKAAEAVSKEPQTTRGIIFGSSGQGEAMVANKYPAIRCAVFYAPVIPHHAVDVTGRTSTDPLEMIRLTREHNDANMLSLGAKILSEENALNAILLWLKTPFSEEERHMRRIEKIKAIEQDLSK